MRDKAIKIRARLKNLNDPTATKKCTACLNYKRISSEFYHYTEKRRKNAVYAFSQCKKCSSEKSCALQRLLRRTDPNFKHRYSKTKAEWLCKQPPDYNAKRVAIWRRKNPDKYRASTIRCSAAKKIRRRAAVLGPEGPEIKRRNRESQKIYLARLKKDPKRLALFRKKRAVYNKKYRKAKLRAAIAR